MKKVEKTGRGWLCAEVHSIPSVKSQHLRVLSSTERREVGRVGVCELC